MTGVRRTVAFVLSGTLALWLSAGVALAVQPGEMLKDPALERRAREISEQLRCMVCQNESIDESNADLAHDLRVLVRERLKAGDSDRQVIEYIAARYGDFVLLKPRFNATNALLWATPAVVFVGGAVLAWSTTRRKKARGSTLSAAEEEELRQALEKRR